MLVDDKQAREKIEKLIAETESRSTFSVTDNSATLAHIVQRDLRRHLLDALRQTDLSDCKVEVDKAVLEQLRNDVIESLSAQVAALTERLYRYDHWTPDHTIEQWLADVQGRLDAADSWIRGERL